MVPKDSKEKNSKKYNSTVAPLARKQDLVTRDRPCYKKVVFMLNHTMLLQILKCTSRHERDRTGEDLIKIMSSSSEL